MSQRPVPHLPTACSALPGPAGAVLAHPPGVPVRLPVHPGRFLERHYLKPLALSQSEAARRLGISRRRMNELVMGHRAMSPDTAIRCAIAFGLPASAWLAMQSDWDCWHAWRTLKQGAAPDAQAGAAGDAGEPAEASATATAFAAPPRAATPQHPPSLPAAARGGLAPAPVAPAT